MAATRPLTGAKRLLSTSLRCHLHHTVHTSSDPPRPRVFRNPLFNFPLNLYLYSHIHIYIYIGVAEDGKGVPRTVSERIIVNDKWAVMRYDLPGLNSEGVKLRLNEEKHLEIEGEYDHIPKFGPGGGSYTLVVPANPRFYEMEQWKAEVKHGVLWLTLPLTPIGQRAHQYFKNNPPPS